jgi:integrase
MPITQFELDALKPKDRPYTIREKQMHKKDGVLAFKVLPSGVIDSYFIYYTQGREKQRKIGRYGKKSNELTLKQIRAKYGELSREYQGGVDVKEREKAEAAAREKAQQEQAEADRKRKLQGSFQQLLDAYVLYAETNLGAHYSRAVKNAFAFNLQGFDTSIKADAVTRSHIRSILKPITDRGALIMANRMRSYISAAFAWAIEQNEEESPIADSVQFFVSVNPVAGIKKPLKDEGACERFLTENELKIFWHALSDSLMAEHRKKLLKLMICLGTRIEAVAWLKWSEIDFSDRVITIPPARSKNGLFWVIPLANTAYDILQVTPRLHDEFVFPAENGIEPLQADGLNQAVGRLCRKVGLEKFTPRDLRTTFKTLSGKAGLSKEIRDRIQNHSLSDVSTKHYDRYSYLNEKRAAMDTWDRFLLRAINGVDDNVIQLKARVPLG